MPEYTTRWIATLLSIAVIAALLTATMATVGLNYLSHQTRVYQQIVDYSSNVQCDICSASWPKITHTLVVSGHRVESTIAVLALSEPSPSPEKITITTEFNPGDNLVPRLVSGDLSWDGEMHQSQTIEIRAVFILEQDGRYYISGSAASHATYAINGARSNYYMYVEGGLVLTITQTPLGPPVTTVKAAG